MPTQRENTDEANEAATETELAALRARNAARGVRYRAYGPLPQNLPQAERVADARAASREADTAAARCGRAAVRSGSRRARAHADRAAGFATEARAALAAAEATT